MSNSYRSLASVRARNAALASGRLPRVTVAPQYPEPPPPFTNKEWFAWAADRETVDNVAIMWRVTVKLFQERKPRVFYIPGKYPEVLRGVRILFPKFESIAVETAGAEIEIADTRLALITTGRFAHV